MGENRVKGVLRGSVIIRGAVELEQKARAPRTDAEAFFERADAIALLRRLYSSFVTIS